MTLSIETLYEQHNAALLSFVRAQGVDSHTAEDIVSDVWMEAARKMTHDGAPRAWLFQTARWRIIDQARRDTRHAAAELLDVIVAPEPPAAPSVPLDQLTPRQRRVMELHLAGYSNLQVASMLDTTVGAVKALQHRAKVELKRILSGEPKRVKVRRVRAPRVRAPRVRAPRVRVPCRTDGCDRLASLPSRLCRRCYSWAWRRGWRAHGKIKEAA